MSAGNGSASQQICTSTCNASMSTIPGKFFCFVFVYTHLPLQAMHQQANRSTHLHVHTQQGHLHTNLHATHLHSPSQVTLFLFLFTLICLCRQHCHHSCLPTMHQCLHTRIAGKFFLIFTLIRISSTSTTICVCMPTHLHTNVHHLHPPPSAFTTICVSCQHIRMPMQHPVPCLTTPLPFHHITVVYFLLIHVVDKDDNICHFMLILLVCKSTSAMIDK